MIKIDEKDNRITLQIANKMDLVSPLAEALNAFCVASTGNESCAFQIQCAVVEAVNNIILHGYKNTSNDIIVQCLKENSALLIEIIDYGVSMSALPTPTLPAFEAESGRGWWIIHSCVDHYSYQVIEDNPINQHQNILTLTKHF